jgi:MEMO1 family protein
VVSFPPDGPDPVRPVPEEGPDFPRLRPLEVFPAQVDGRQVLCLRDPLHLTDSVVSLPRQAAAILGLFDGRHSLLDIQEAHARRFGSLLFRGQLLELIHSLDEHLLLDSPRFARHREAVEAEFRRSLERPAQLAGRAYPSDPLELQAQMDGFFSASDGPGTVLASPDAARLTGLIAPHIDFQRGGPCYAWSYREAGPALDADRWVILGTVHAPIVRPFTLTRKSFRTPHGTAENDRAFTDDLLARVGERYLDDEFAHRGEHSIEFQCVFLRRLVLGPLRIVPVLCGSLHEAIEAGRPPIDGEVAEFLAALGETAAKHGGRTIFVASADLAHIGPQFGDEDQITPDILRVVEAADRKMLAQVEAGDAGGFFRAVAQDGDRRRICGLPPIYAMLRLLDGCRGRLLHYGQWPDPNGTVTFAALAMYGKEAVSHQPSAVS